MLSDLTFAKRKRTKTFRKFAKIHKASSNHLSVGPSRFSFHIYEFQKRDGNPASLKTDQSGALQHRAQ